MLQKLITFSNLFYDSPLIFLAMSLPNDIETKIYVAGLPWITKTESLRNYFEQFGEIVYANVVCDRATKRSKGFGFVSIKTLCNM